MPFAFKILKAQPGGTGANQTLYTTPGGKSAIVINLRFHNPSTTTAATVDVIVKDSSTGTAIAVGRYSVPASGQNLHSRELTLGAGQLVLLTVTGAPVDCLVSGVERDGSA